MRFEILLSYGKFYSLWGFFLNFLLSSFFVRHFNYIIRQLAITHCRKPKIIWFFLVYLSSFSAVFSYRQQQNTQIDTLHNFPSYFLLACASSRLNLIQICKTLFSLLSYVSTAPRARREKLIIYFSNCVLYLQSLSRLHLLKKKNKNSFSYFFTNPQNVER